MIVTSGGYRAYQARTDTDAADIAAFDFTDPVADHPDLKRRFFDLTDVPPDTLVGNVVALLLAGYPSTGQTYDLEANNRLQAVEKLFCSRNVSESDRAQTRFKTGKPLAAELSSRSER